MKQLKGAGGGKGGWGGGGRGGYKMGVILFAPIAAC